MKDIPARILAAVERYGGWQGILDTLDAAAAPQQVPAAVREKRIDESGMEHVTWQAPAAPSPDVEAQARELLAAEMDKAGMGKTAEHCRAGTLVAGHMPAIRAITAALRQPVQSGITVARDEQGLIVSVSRDGQVIAYNPEYVVRQQPVLSAPGVVGEVSDEFTNIAGERWHEVRWFAKPEVGTKLYAAPNPQPVDDDQCIAVYDAVMRSGITRDVKTPERKAEIVRAALEAALRPQ